MPDEIATAEERETLQRRLGPTEIIQLVVFVTGEEEFGVNIAQIREIIRKGTITPLPDSPDFIKGVTNVRGDIVVVIDLANRFFLPIKKQIESRHIIITEQEKTIFGLMVDEVTEVLRIPQADIKPSPGIVSKIERKFISGVVTLQNRLIILLDLAKVLGEGDLVRLAEITRHHPAMEREEIKGEEVEVQRTEDRVQRTEVKGQRGREARLPSGRARSKKAKKRR